MQLRDLLAGDVAALTAHICDIPSVSGNEGPLADEIEEALSALPHLEVMRDGNAVLARTHLGVGRRAIIAGHIDTVPIKGTLPTRLERAEAAPIEVSGSEVRSTLSASQPGETEVLWGRGTVDMKGGCAVALHLAATLVRPTWDVTWVFYDNEEVDAEVNGLGRIARNLPEWLEADFAILGEPTNGQVEAGCNGTLRADVTFEGKTAHSARAWRGVNAVHAAGPALERLRAYVPETVQVDGLDYRESMSAVSIRGGIANNMIPDECTVAVNYRFAPSRTLEEAERHVRELFDGLDCAITVVDAAAAARPRLDAPAAAQFVATAREFGSSIGPKYGWTDVSRFAALGIPAVNFGPGDPMLAHADDERCPTDQIRRCANVLGHWLMKE